MTGFNLSALAVRERAVTLFLMIAISLAGAFAFFKLGRAEDPTFTVKAMTVVSVWPGATAAEMQDLVADPLEKRLQELRWYDRSETFTRPGLAFTTLTLRDEIPPADVQDEYYQARKKLGDEARNLPAGVIGPIINDEYSDVSFALYALTSHDMPHRLLALEAEKARQRLLRVQGVKKVEIIGEQPGRLFVEIDHTRLATLGLAPADIVSALVARNQVALIGSVETKGPDIIVRLDSPEIDEDSIGNITIAANGRTFRLADIANVKRGYLDPAEFLIRSQGKPAILLGVVMREGWNGLDLGHALEDEAAAISAEMPLGITLSKVTDQSVNIQSAVSEFMLKFAMALAVVMGVSFLSLGWRVGIIVAAAVPLTLAIVFIVMMATGRDFDRITLGALILSLGLLVDDAIIAIETMLVKMEEGWDRIRASAYAWSHTAAPMLSGTLVTAIGLMPVGFAQSSTGEYAGNIFWIVGIALIASWIVAVVFTPYLGVKLLPEIKVAEGGHHAIYDTPGYRKLRRTIAFTIRRKWLTAGGVALSFILAAAAMGLVRQQFFPSSDRPEMLVEVQMPYGTGIQRTSSVVSEIEAWLSRQSEAEIVTAYIGQGAPRFFLSMSPELPDPAFAKLVVLTPDEAARDALIQRLRVAASDGLGAGARVRATQLTFGPYSPWPVAFRVSGPDGAEVRRIARAVEEVMLQYPDLRQVNTDWGTRTPALRLVLDQDRIAAMGLNSAAVREQIATLINGAIVTELRDGTRKIGVVMRSAGDTRLDPDQIGNFSIVAQNGQRIPLSQVARIATLNEEPVLRRRDRLPTITVSADIAAGLQPPDVSNAVHATLKPVIETLPAGYRIDVGGPVEEAEKANASLAPIFPIMLLLMMIVIVFQVRSLSALAMVLLTAPLGLVGAVPALLMTGKPFGFTAIIGLIGLAGILMRNTLILIGQVHDNEKEGQSLYEAVVEATVQRARPVILTALAAVLAFIPLTFSVFWGAMATTLIGGTIVGTILTLVVLPALCAIWFKIAPPQAATEPSDEADDQLPATA